MTKSERHEAIRERARAAIRNMYHNATPSYPSLDDEQAREFESWFQGEAESEIDYIGSGGAYGTDYRKTLEHPANSGKFKSEAAKRYYIRMKLRERALEQIDCGMVTGWRVLEVAAGNERVCKKLAQHKATDRNDALWERITEFGKLHTWGRGGRTLAPKDLVSDRGPSWGVKEDYADEKSIARVMDIIRVVESFNSYVECWNKGIPEMWTEYKADQQAEERAKENCRRAAKAKETRERNYWAARGVVTQ